MHLQCTRSCLSSTYAGSGDAQFAQHDAGAGVCPQVKAIPCQPAVQVLSIDEQSTTGWNGDQAAQLLRGRSGSSVSVRFARRSDQVPGVPGRPEPMPHPSYELKQVAVPACLEGGSDMAPERSCSPMQPIPAGLRITQGISSSWPAQRARCAAACREPAPLLLCAATSHVLQSEKDSGASADPNTTLPAGLEEEAHLLYAVTKMVASPAGGAARHSLFTRPSPA